MGNKGIEDTSSKNKGLIKSCNEDSDTEYFLRVDVRYPRKSNETHNDFHFYQKKNEKIVRTLGDKKEYVGHI